MMLPGGDILPEQQAYKALYLHIPFCKSKCVYCDFDSETISADDEAIERYVDELILQIRAASRAELLGSLETVYIGGGTPTHIGNKQLSRLLYGLSLSMHLTPEVECTLEVNPESLTEAMVKDLFALGVTRLSIGVQSFDEEVLKILGRAHDAAQAKHAIELAQMRFANISVDLMCGLPGQTKESFIQSLETAVDLGVTHISIYPLSIEPDTPLHGLMEREVFTESEDDLAEYAAEMMLLAQDFLHQRGFRRYEVASYAKPGFECRHNIAYWTGKPYLGIGRAAVTMKQNLQERVRLRNGEVEEILTRPEYLVEDLMLGMRMSRGVSKELAEQISQEVVGVMEAFNDLVSKGYVRETKDRFEPTDKGWLWGNVLYGRLLELSEDLDQFSTI